MKNRSLMYACCVLLYGCFLLFVCSHAYTQEDKDIAEEGVRLLQQYLRIDTTNPPGNEMPAAVFLKQIADGAGIPNRICNLGNNRANFVALLKGDGSKKGIVLLHHMDVVSAEEKYWKVHPFSGAIIDNAIYGRGALDIKGKGIIDLMAMIHYKRKRMVLSRDIIFLAVADEENNSLGSRWMIENEPSLFKNVEFLIDEGSGARFDKTGKTIAYFFSLGEKSPLWLTINFKGEPGHGSTPIENSAVNRAIRAAHKILAYRSELYVLPDIEEELMRRLSSKECEKMPGYSNSLATSLHCPLFLETIAKDPEIGALLKDTIAITCLQGSDKINTISNEARIGLDCRLLPGVDKQQFVQKLLEIMDDHTAEIKIEEYIPATKSPRDTAFVHALTQCARQREAGVKVIPVILTSSTDASYYRLLGIHCYGFEPYRIRDEDDDLCHGNNERISVDNIRFGIGLLTDILAEMEK